VTGGEAPAEGDRMRTAAEVIGGEARWSCEAADAVEFVRGLPDDSVDLLFSSPPYELARTYGIGEKMVGGQAWVDWMVELVRAAAPKVKGLIAINCEGQTRNYSYSGVPFLLFADLKRAGFNMRKPPVFHRVGIPGSGGPDWLRNDYEPIVCVTREGRLPWSDPTACGKPPRYGPGGDMSNRKVDGGRVSKLAVPGGRRRAGNGGMESQRDKALARIDNGYRLPEIANPGNVYKCATGGGKMGHPLSHENEAPFPLALAAFFVKSFCPPDGIVCDPFSGSGTTCHAAIEHGRRFVGCDVRQSQVDLCERRLRSVTPNLIGA
jgi:hypothetical protein